MFTVLNQVSGKSFQSNGEVSVLDGALSHGLNFPYGCQNGFCGKCKAVILNGEIEYDGEIPSAITEEEVEASMALLANARRKVIYTLPLMNWMLLPISKFVVFLVGLKK